MKSYLVHVHGKGGGCDYTIGCNHSVEYARGETLEEAQENWWHSYVVDRDLEEMSASSIEEAFSDNDIYTLPERAVFYELSPAKEMSFSFERRKKELVALAEDRENEEKAKKEKAELKRLQEKYAS